MNMKGAFLGLAALVAVATGGFVVGGFHTIDNSEYQIVKSFSGETHIEKKPGWYVNYGTEDTYRFLGSLDFSRKTEPDTTRDREGYAVKYNDAEGVVEGTLYVDFPEDKEHRMMIHSKFGSQSAAMAMVDKAMQEAFNLTAGLMKSQEAYMTHRALFRQYALDQLQNGLYQTYVEETTTVSEDGTETKAAVTKIAYQKDADGNYTNIPLRAAKSPLSKYGITVSEFTLTYMGFDQKTEVQIDKRRDAENAVLISKANAERAAQETIEQQQIALKNKAIKEGEANAEASVQVVNAKRDKQLAEITAEQKVAVAKQIKLQRAEDLAAAKLEAQAIDVRSKAKAAAADREIKAGGQLSAEQQTRIAIAKELGRAFANAQRPSTVVLNGSSSENGELTGTSIDGFLQTMTAATATNLQAKVK